MPHWIGVGICTLLVFPNYLCGHVLREHGRHLGRLLASGKEEELRVALHKERWPIEYMAHGIFLGITMFIATFIFLMLFVWEPSAMLDGEP